MPKKTKLRDTGCPVAFALDTFGDRWSLIIIRDMAMKGHKTYGEFLAADEGIATNVLADRLIELESLEVVEKLRDPADGRRHIYQLTNKGVDLIPVLLEMIRWSAQYDANTIVKPAILSRVEKDRGGLASELRARVFERRAKSGEAGRR